METLKEIITEHSLTLNLTTFIACCLTAKCIMNTKWYQTRRKKIIDEIEESLKPLYSINYDYTLYSSTKINSSTKRE